MFEGLKKRAKAVVAAPPPQLAPPDADRWAKKIELLTAELAETAADVELAQDALGLAVIAGDDLAASQALADAKANHAKIQLGLEAARKRHAAELAKAGSAAEQQRRVQARTAAADWRQALRDVDTAIDALVAAVRQAHSASETLFRLTRHSALAHAISQLGPDMVAAVTFKARSVPSVRPTTPFIQDNTAVVARRILDDKALGL